MAFTFQKKKLRFWFGTYLGCKAVTIISSFYVTDKKDLVGGREEEAEKTWVLFCVSKYS